VLRRDGISASHAASESPDLIRMDVALGEMDGWEQRVAQGDPRTQGSDHRLYRSNAIASAAPGASKPVAPELDTPSR